MDAAVIPQAKGVGQGRCVFCIYRGGLGAALGSKVRKTISKGVGPIYLHQVCWNNMHDSRGAGDSIWQGIDGERGSSQADVPRVCIADEALPTATGET